MVDSNTINPGPMLKFPNLRHHQVAYVTTDLKEAMRRLEDAFGLDQYFEIDTRDQSDEQAWLKLALVRTAGTEFELIEPLGHLDAVWSDPLPKDGSFAMQFHHIAATIHGTREDFQRYRDSWDTEKHPIVVDGAVGEDALWFYTDERETLGHYFEHCWFSDGLTKAMAASVPTLAR